jgi:signal transduction histidine kinase
MRLEILVIDDRPESRVALSARVRESGHASITADSGQDALAQLRQAHPDLILLSLPLPDLGLFELTRQVRKLCADRWLPVIALLPLQGDEPATDALTQGADDFLSLPVGSALLRAKLRQYGRVLGLQAHQSALARRQRDILDNILDAVVTLDASGQVEEMNRAAKLAFGCGDSSDTDSKPDSDTDSDTDTDTDTDRDPAEPVPQANGAPFGVELQTLLSGLECRLRRTDGSEFDAEVSSSEWQHQGRVHHTLVLRDLTARHQIERMKDEFLATVSHELRTPLTSVIGALGLLAGGAAGALPAAARPLAEMARRNGERLSGLIDDILDLTKMEGDRLVLHLRTQPVVPLLRDALAANRAYADRVDVKLAASGLDAAAGAELRLDADRFLQVMANLLSNAIKHSPAGSAVTLELNVAPTTLRVTVRDQGPGVDPRFRARLFEKFSQADGGDRRALGGTGLGLYIARMLVERMGGLIAADEMSEGVGASFTVEFPRPPSARSAADPGDTN